jgi:pyrroloquinoline quinone (PQQ) biosynthesis protein C
MRKDAASAPIAPATTMQAERASAGAIMTDAGWFDWSRAEPYGNDELLDRMLALVRQWFFALEHPLARRLLAGDLSLDDLRFLACQEYWYYRCTIWWNAGKVLYAPSADVQRRLIGPLLEEVGADAPSHEQLYVRYLRGLGLDETDLGERLLLAATMTYVHEIYSINTSGELVANLAANNLVVETMRPVQYPRLIEALSRYPEIPGDSLEFFREHVEADVSHGALGVELLGDLMTTVTHQRVAWAALVRSLAVRWQFYDAVDAWLLRREGVLVPGWPTLPHIS